MTIDRFKVMHWMNVRKLTPAQVAALGGPSAEMLAGILDGHDIDISPGDMTRLGRVLRIAPEQVAAREGACVAAVVVPAVGLRATRRPIQRAGIDFYNYYSMAAPPGRVAPVILDILCPAGTLPTLNNGHLEPAITINLGPGDIYGRWGEELSPSTWQVLAANPGVRGNRTRRTRGSWAIPTSSRPTARTATGWSPACPPGLSRTPVPRTSPGCWRR